MEDKKQYAFIVVATIEESDTINQISVQVFDAEDRSDNPLPVATGSAPNYDNTGLATAAEHAFARVPLPLSK